MSSIIFTDNEDNPVEYEVVETTTLGGNTYLLVADKDDNAYILKELYSAGDEETSSYTGELTEAEHKAVAAVFAELLDDADIALDQG